MPNDQERQAYLDGIHARQQGVPVNANPHTARAFVLWNAWRDGWSAEDRSLRTGE